MRADRYMLQVLADRRAGAAREPELLDLSRKNDGLAAELRRIGFRVTAITLRDGSLETLAGRLAGMTATFDAVCCRGVLSMVDDWPEVVGRIGRRLRPGGTFLYSVYSVDGPPSGAGRLWQRIARAFRARGSEAGDIVSRHRSIPAADLAASLRRIGLVPRQIVTESGAYVGYSVRRADRAATATEMRWELTGTGERWIAARRT